MRNIVEKEWLLNQLESSAKLVVLDCRFKLGEADSGSKAFQLSHIPGSIYCHLENDLSGPVLEHGGRHPLPSMEKLAAFLEHAGIENDSVVVAYDSGEGAYASRLWWLMKYVGHDKVYILNGGFMEWENAGYPIDNRIISPNKTKYNIKLQPQLLAHYLDVKETVANRPQQTVLIDSREPRRYKGMEEPIDKIPGRIPGAINKFWADGLESGRFKSLEEQKHRFSELNPNDHIIVYCGSGITATPNYLMLKELGYKHVKLYAGSYSDWISYTDNEIEAD